MLTMGVSLPDEPDSPELKPDEVISRLDEALETCRSVVSDYRGFLRSVDTSQAAEGIASADGKTSV